MNNIFTKSISTIIIFLSFNVFALESFTASKYEIVSGDTTTLSWTKESPSQFVNPIFNLYVSKPGGTARFMFKGGITGYSFNRMITLIGTHTFEVEACEANNVTYCSELRSLTVTVTPSVTCNKVVNSSSLYYECGGTKITQTANPVSSNLYETITDFQVHGNMAVWKFSSDGVQAYYVSEIFKSQFFHGNIQQITQSAYVLSLDQLAFFQLIKSRAIWYFKDDTYKSHAFYETCIDDSFIDSPDTITDIAYASRNGKIVNFNTSGETGEDIFTWDYSDTWVNPAETRSKTLTNCK